MESGQLDQLELDTLKEIVGIGANRGVGPMSKVLGERVEVTVPALHVITIEAVADQLGEAGQGMTVVVVKIKGDARGIILLLLTPENARRLVAEISQGLDGSALDEVVNILAGSALGALARFVGLKLLQSVPGRATDMLRATVNEVVAELGVHAEDVLMMRMEFHTVRTGASGQLCFLFDPESTDRILQAGRAQMGAEGVGYAGAN